VPHQHPGLTRGAAIVGIGFPRLPPAPGLIPLQKKRSGVATVGISFPRLPPVPGLILQYIKNDWGAATVGNGFPCHQYLQDGPPGGITTHIWKNKFYYLT